MFEGTRNTNRRDLLGLVKQQVTPQAIQAVAVQLGEDRERTASAVSTSMPSVLSALSAVAETDRGAAHLKAAIEAKASPASRSATMSLLGGGGTGTDDRLLDDELGRRSWEISDDVARSSGIRPDSAHKLLGGVTSVALLALAKTGTSTSPEALRSLLREQAARGETVYTAPDHAYEGREHAFEGPAIRTLERPSRSRWWLIAAGLILAAIIAIPLIRGIQRNRQAPAPAATPTETVPTPKSEATPPAPAPQAAAPAAPAEEPQAAAPTEEQQQAAPPAAEQQAAPPVAEQQAAPPAAEQQAAPPAAEQQAAPPAAGQQAAPPVAEEPAAPSAAEQQQAAPPVAEEPKAAAPSENPADLPVAPAEGSVNQIASFLDSPEGATPRTFSLAPLTFATGATSPSGESMKTVDQLAEVLTSHPTTEITLSSHTDSTGSTTANEALAEARSESVKALLVERGVDEARISTTGHGRSEPVDTNATSAGRANNRRTDVIVTSR